MNRLRALIPSAVPTLVGRVLVVPVTVERLPATVPQQMRRQQMQARRRLVRQQREQAGMTVLEAVLVEPITVAVGLVSRMAILFLGTCRVVVVGKGLLACRNLERGGVSEDSLLFQMCRMVLLLRKPIHTMPFLNLGFPQWRRRLGIRFPLPSGGLLLGWKILKFHLLRLLPPLRLQDSLSLIAASIRLWRNRRLK